MNSTIEREGQIVTFYSYKGGTGRTMALANVAVITARLMGTLNVAPAVTPSKKVLLIDWDLEAPGLHRFFFPLFKTRNEAEIYNTPGLIEFFMNTDQKIRAMKPGTETVAEENMRSLMNGLMEELIGRHISETSLPGLFILKAGSYNDIYSANISKFNWEQFFNNAPSFFRIFSEKLKKEFDYVFIDSRTGLNDTSGICTMLMPDKLCLVFTPNRQSLDGVKNSAHAALKYRLHSSDMRPLMIYPIPSRVEIGEKDLRDEWRKGSQEKKLKGFQVTFEELFNEYYGTVHCNLTRYFDEVQIHHEPRYSYGEEIAVLNETYSDRLSLSKVYTAIQKRITSDAPFWEEGEGIKIYISHSRKDKKLVDELSDELTKSGNVILRTEDISAGEDLFRSLEARVLSADVFIPLVTKTFQSDNQYSSLEVFTFLDKKPPNERKLIIPLFSDREMATNNYFGLNSFQGIFTDEITPRKGKRAAELASKIQQSITDWEAANPPAEVKVVNDRDTDSALTPIVA
jgi:MinD-like ATPase involved in chromosome partitioning or flagellar assembly